MPVYTLSETSRRPTAPISGDMFGTNYVTIYDHEIAESEDRLELLGALEPSTLRYAGGSVTEGLFTDAVFLTGAWEAGAHTDAEGVTRRLTPLSDVMQAASRAQADVQLVIPTRVGFRDSMGQALASGTYGARSELEPGYFAHVRAYVDAALQAAEQEGVRVSRLELGNEFWGSGEMTASEYGYLAARLTVFLASLYPEMEIVAQVVSSANRYSPREARHVYLEPDGDGDFILHELESSVSPRPGWELGTLPGNSSGRAQTETIAEQFRAVPGALAALSGIVEHIYFDAGFGGIDTEKDFVLGTIPAAFAAGAGIEDIDYFVTEWGVRNPQDTAEEDNLGNANGLHYAQSLVEAFFELASQGVDGANIWPLTFGSPGVLHRTLIDSVEAKLTFGGETFRWLSAELPGMRPAFDLEVAGEIDLHGFEGEGRLVIFAAEREGARGGEIGLDLAQFVESSERFVRIEQMTSLAPDPLSLDAAPLVTRLPGTMLTGPLVTFARLPWALTQVLIQPVSEEADRLEGGPAGDRILGAGGSDVIRGQGGNDTLKGQLGDDTLSGGAGEDRIVAGWGRNLVHGGEGDDWISGGPEDDTLSGGTGDDLIEDEGGDDLAEGGAGEDVLRMRGGRDLILAGEGEDRIVLDSAARHAGATSAVNVGAFGGTGTGTVQDLAGKAVYQVVVDGGPGEDLLVLSETADAFFLQDDFAGYPLAAEEDGGAPARLSGIERIVAAGGDDVIDLTSQRFSLAGQRLRIVGGEGDDVIWGSDADEEILGGAGADTLFGGTGADSLWGGTGADSFEFTRSSAGVVIGDFSPEEGDVLRFYTSENVQFGIGSLEMQGDRLRIPYWDEQRATAEMLTIVLANLPEAVGAAQIVAAVELA